METETQAGAALRLLKCHEIGLVTYYLVSRPVIHRMAGLSFGPALCRLRAKARQMNASKTKAERQISAGFSTASRRVR